MATVTKYVKPKGKTGGGRDDFGLRNATKTRRGITKKGRRHNKGDLEKGDRDRG